MMCGVETHLQRVMPATITTSAAASNGPLRSSGSERDEIGIPGGNDRNDLTCSSSSPSKSQDIDKPPENVPLSNNSQRRRNSDINLPGSTPGTAHLPPRPVSIINDDFGSSDEVKVFKDEDDRDGSSSESHQAELLAEKSSLITESEQERGSSSPHPGGDKEHGLCGLVDGIGSVSAGDLSLAGKFFDTSFGMGYLMSPYAAAYANGLTNGSHMVRSNGSPLSPFLYAATAGASGSGVHGDPMSSPPPAHMGTYLDKSTIGLRPPIYPLPTSQYPYAMLGADQLAACPMSHFSSSTGLLSHPGLSSSGQLPHLKQEFSGKDSGGHLKSKYMKKKEPHIKKPLNAFMIYMKDMRPVVQAECTLKESAAINQLLGRRWHGLTREEQAKYYEKARVERQKHMQMYPHWNARDNYRFGTKKKKRTKREKAIEASKDNSMKKCRARFGLEQHNLWCKPCSPIGSDFNSHNGSYNQIPSPSLTSHQHQGLSLGESTNHSNTNPSDISKVPQQYTTNNNNTPLLSPPPPPPPPSSALSTLLQHPPPTLFSPGSCGTSMQNNHHQSSPISVASGIHEIMMQSSTSPLNVANSQIHESNNHLVPPPLHSATSASSDCYSPLGNHSHSQGSPNRIGINNNNHNLHHTDHQSQHSISHLEHHLQQLQQQPKHNTAESPHSNQQQEDTVYSHAPEYISL